LPLIQCPPIGFLPYQSQPEILIHPQEGLMKIDIKKLLDEFKYIATRGTAKAIEPVLIDFAR
jgi:hypothetical protein